MLAPTFETESRPMPAWLSIPIILFCLLAGGWMIHWYVISDPISHESKPLGETARPALADRPNPGRGPGGIGGGGGGGGAQALRNLPVPHLMQNPVNQRWELKTEMARVEVSLDKGTMVLSPTKINFHSMIYNNVSVLPEDVRNTVQLTRKLINDNDRTEKLKLTRDQVSKLRALAFSTTNMNMSLADRAALGQQITRVIEASEKDRPGMEPALFATLDEIASRSIAPTIQTATDHVKQIDQIMTPELWKQYSDMTGGK